MSNITNFSANINVAFPIAGQDNSSQGFRDNFALIANAFATANSEITALQSSIISQGNVNDFGDTTSIIAGNIGGASTVLTGLVDTAIQSNITQIGAQTVMSANVQSVAPTTGTTVAIGEGVTALLVNPAGTLSSLTINMPTGNVNGQVIFTGFSQTISSLTMNPGGSNSIPGALTSAGAGTGATWVFYNNIWYRVS